MSSATTEINRAAAKPEGPLIPDLLEKMNACVSEYGEDLPEIRNWRWSAS